MSRSAKTLADALAEVPAASQLLSRVQASQSVARLLAAASPPITGGFDPLRPGACELRSGLLILTATSSAQAAKLRQELPRLQKLLRQQGLEVSQIRVQLQPAHMSYREEASAAAQVPPPPDASPDAPRKRVDLASALRSTDELALTLKDSSLRAAVERLAATLRSIVTRKG